MDIAKITVEVAGGIGTVLAEPREFKTGSRGFYGQAKRWVPGPGHPRAWWGYPNRSVPSADPALLDPPATRNGSSLVRRGSRRACRHDH